MITIKIKTWKCNCCGYSQDFEPHQDHMNLHFNNDQKFPLNNLQAFQCPSCQECNGLQLITDESQMIQTNHLEQSDKDNIVQNMQNEKLQNIKVGSKQIVNKETFEIETIDITRKETNEEKNKRIHNYIETTIIKTKDEIKTFKEQYEYK